MVSFPAHDPAVLRRCCKPTKVTMKSTHSLSSLFVFDVTRLRCTAMFSTVKRLSLSTKLALQRVSSVTRVATFRKIVRSAIVIIKRLLRFCCHRPRRPNQMKLPKADLLTIAEINIAFVSNVGLNSFRIANLIIYKEDCRNDYLRLVIVSENTDF